MSKPQSTPDAAALAKQKVLSDERAFFPWVCRKIGGIFLLKGSEPPYICPCCGTEDAFEQGDCRRVFAEEVLERERSQR